MLTRTHQHISHASSSALNVILCREPRRSQQGPPTAGEGDVNYCLVIGPSAVRILSLRVFARAVLIVLVALDGLRGLMPLGDVFGHMEPYPLH